MNALLFETKRLNLYFFSEECPHKVKLFRKVVAVTLQIIKTDDMGGNITSLHRTKSLSPVCPYVCSDLLNYALDLDAVFLLDRVIQEEGLCV